MATVVRRPQPGDPSYELFNHEKTSVLTSLAERAELVAGLLNEIPGIQCNKVEGAMYAFPRLDLPHKFLQKVKVSISIWLNF